MAITSTTHGRYTYYVSNESAVTDAAKELAEQLDNDGIQSSKIVVFDTTNKFVIVTTY